ncbi:MAG: hypothetical protein NTZ10_00730 [Candidatus Saganbacteria bacterium]|nr:hypothetical protein [Candidatus Saganbacteria bacterium]
MKKSLVFAAVLFVLLFGSQCLAFRPAVIGGIRDGAALGIMLESGPANNATLRLGAEISTSNNPGIIFIGGKFFLSNINNRYPMFLSGGLVGYLGNNSDAGPYISLIFERFLDVTPLFLEVGVDAVRSGRLQLQAGYYF